MSYFCCGVYMEASVNWEDNVIIVKLSGTLDFDKAYEFKKKSLRHFIQNKVVFSIKDLNFVGSTGMSSFIETLSEISVKNPNGVLVCDVGLEYKRLFETFLNDKLQICNSVSEAKQTTLPKPLVIPEEFNTEI